MDVVAAMDDPGLFGPWFEGASWDGWRALLKGAFALPMTEEERTFFRSVADRDPPDEPVRELWVVAGRRTGKDSIASLVGSHAAALFDRHHRLRPGERALVMCLASDREQAKIVLGYSRAYFDRIPMLKAMVTRETAGCFELENGVDFAVATNNFRATRGRSILLCIGDEMAFWADENSARPDKETYRSVVPGLATLGGMFIGISSPYAKSGLLYEKWKKHYGRDGDVLVIRAPSVKLNPTLDTSMIERELEEDPAAARAEWLAEWREDVASFIDVSLVEAAVDSAVMVRPRRPGVDYKSFIDPSSGTGRDSFTAAIGHSEDGVAVLDAVLEIRPPFSSDAAIEEVAKLLKSYGLSDTIGDRYAAGFVVQAFAKCGISYRHSERDRSQIYLECLPLFTSRRARLVDNRRLVIQFAALERRPSSSGKDRVDHPQHGGADDVCNAAAGALVLTQPQRSTAWGVVEFYRREAQRIADNPLAPPEPPAFGFVLKSAAEPDGVLIEAPPGVSSFYDSAGRSYVIGVDRTLTVPRGEVPPLRAAGWRLVELEGIQT